MFAPPQSKVIFGVYIANPTYESGTLDCVSLELVVTFTLSPGCTFPKPLLIVLYTALVPPNDQESTADVLTTIVLALGVGPQSVSGLIKTDALAKFEIV